MILVLNALLGFVQEARAEQAVAALQRMAAPTSNVLRDGNEVSLPAADLVPGDVLLLAEGDAVSADGRDREASVLRRDARLGLRRLLRQDGDAHPQRDDHPARRHALREVDVTGIGYAPEGELFVDGRLLEDGPLLEEVRIVLSGGSLANDSSLREEGGSWVVQGDPTEAAFLVAERKAGFSAPSGFAALARCPSPRNAKLMSTIEIDSAHDGRAELVTKGAPDVLLARCTHEQVGGEQQPLTDDRRREILWINLLTNLGPALALGVDPPPEDVMAQPPRKLSHRVIDRDGGGRRVHRSGDGDRHAARARHDAPRRANRGYG